MTPQQIVSAIERTGDTVHGMEQAGLYVLVIRDRWGTEFIRVADHRQHDFESAYAMWNARKRSRRTARTVRVHA